MQGLLASGCGLLGVKRAGESFLARLPARSADERTKPEGWTLSRQASGFSVRQGWGVFAQEVAGVGDVAGFGSLAFAGAAEAMGTTGASEAGIGCGAAASSASAAAFRP